MGDFNFDGIVDAQDFAIMNANSTLSTLAPLGLLDLTPIPEPTTALTLLAGTLFLIRRRPLVHRLRRISQRKYNL